MSVVIARGSHSVVGEIEGGIAQGDAFPLLTELMDFPADGDLPALCMEGKDGRQT